MKTFVSHSTPDSACLDKTNDDFPAYDQQSSSIMPGYFYDALKQCQMTFGPEATVAEGYLESKASFLTSSFLSIDVQIMYEVLKLWFEKGLRVAIGIC